MLFFEASILGKWLAMLKEIAPQLKRVALVANPKTTPYDYFLRAAAAIAPSQAIELVASRVAAGPPRGGGPKLAPHPTRKGPPQIL